MRRTQSLPTALAEEVVAIDGEALRHELDDGESLKVIVSVYTEIQSYLDTVLAGGPAKEPLPSADRRALSRPRALLKHPGLPSHPATSAPPPARAQARPWG